MIFQPFLNWIFPGQLYSPLQIIIIMHQCSSHGYFTLIMLNCQMVSLRKRRLTTEPPLSPSIQVFPLLCINTGDWRFATITDNQIKRNYFSSTGGGGAPPPPMKCKHGIFNINSMCVVIKHMKSWISCMKNCPFANVNIWEYSKLARSLARSARSHTEIFCNVVLCSFANI